MNQIEKALSDYLGEMCGMRLQPHALTGLAKAAIAAMQSAPNSKGSQMSDELNVWREAIMTQFGCTSDKKPDAAAPVIRDYGDRRDADAYQRGKLEGARLALEAAAKDAEEWFPFDTSKRYPSFGVVASIRALDPAKIVGEG